MSRTVIVIGAGGHARSVLALLSSNSIAVAGIYDASYSVGKMETIHEVPVAGSMNDVPHDKPVILAVGSCAQRAEFYETYKQQVIRENVVHPSAVIEKYVQAGESNLVFARAVINADAVIGKNNIINTASVIEHECVIGDHNHISVGALVCGRVKIGSYCFIGAGSVIKDKVSICDNVTIGAGGVVVKSITEPGVYAGNPVRKIK